MILEHLSLRNFKRFKDVDITFKHGITGIVGMNGAGKSSIVDAIFFALYGVSGGLASDFIVSSFADREKCEVVLDFSVGGKAYCIVRKFGKGKTIQHDAKIMVAGIEIATGVSQVEVEVRRILGMGSVDFRNTVYAAQKDLMTLLDLTPGKRREWFLRALGIDYLNTGSQKILKELVDTKEKKALLLQGELVALDQHDATILVQLRDDISVLENEIITLKSKDVELSSKQTLLSTEKQHYDEKVMRRDKIVTRETELQRDITNLTKRIESLDIQLASLAVDEQDMRNLKKIVTEIPQVRKEIELHRSKKSTVERLTSELDTVEREKVNIRIQIEKIRLRLVELNDAKIENGKLHTRIVTALGFGNDYADIENAISDFSKENTKRVATLSANLLANKDLKSKIEKNLKAIRSIGPEGECPTCLQKLGTHFETVENDYLAQLDIVIKEGVAINEQLGIAVGESDKIVEVKPLLDRMRQIIILLGSEEHLVQTTDDLNTNLTASLTRLTNLASEIDKVGYSKDNHLVCELHLIELENSQSHLNDITNRFTQQFEIKARITELHTHVSDKNTTLAEVKSNIDDSPIDPDTGSKLSIELENISNALKTTNHDLATATERKLTATRKIADIELVITRIEVIKQHITTLMEEVEILKLTRTAISDYVIYIMRVVRTRIESEVGCIISEITGGKYDRVFIDEDFNLLVRENDLEYSVDRFSGGEQDVIAVALRIALSKYLAELHNVRENTLLIFDEIFGSQDEERRANLLTALRSQRSRFPQIILISHIVEIQGEFENTLVVQTNGSVSTITEGY